MLENAIMQIDEIAKFTDGQWNSLSEDECRRIEALCRRAARRQGYQVQKSRSRDPRAPDHGLYRIVDCENGNIQNGSLWTTYSMSLGDVADWLVQT
jgi:hypothetical protein